MLNTNKMQDQPSTVSFCLSFNSYSSDCLSAIADRVSEEDRQKVDGICLDQTHRNHDESTGVVEENDDEEFEFVLVRANPDDLTATTLGGDELMASYPVFPVFNRDLLLEYQNDYQIKDREDEKVSAIRLPLGKLFIEDRDPSSSSSSEADELEGVAPGTYCVWTPAKSPYASPSPSGCKKSNSTGSSSKQKWRLRDLLHLRRNSSDGKQLIFFNSDHNNSNCKNSSESNFEKRKEKMTTAAKSGKAKEKVSAHEVFYVRNKTLKEGDKKRSYLPYRQGLVGFFTQVNGLGRTFPPF